MGNRHVRVRPGTALPLLAAIALACSSDPASPNDLQHFDCERLEMALASVVPEAVGTQYAIDAEQEVVARVVPGGFAGVLLTGSLDRRDGHTIILVHPDSADATRRTAARAAECAAGGPLEQMFLWVAGSVDVQPANWDMVTLRRWERSLRQLAAEVTGTTPETSIGTWINLIYVRVPDEAAQLRIEADARSLGIPEGAVIVMVGPPPG